MTLAPARVTVAGLTFDALLAGPDDGEPVVLLHGFPQTSACWLTQLEALAGAGFRALAPDQRGYSPGARPAGTAGYRVDRLAGDVTALAEALGLGPFHLVGHDWGGAVAWRLAATEPGRLRSVAVVSTPHPRALARAMVRSDQVLRSAYIGFFKLPVLPEAALLAGEGALLRRVLLGSGLSEPWADAYVRRMRPPGALSAALAWYRANGPGLGAGTGTIGVPTLYVWGRRDPTLGPTAARATADHVDGPYRFEVLEDAGHWIPEDHPRELSRLLLEHLGGPRPRGAGGRRPG